MNKFFLLFLSSFYLMACSNSASITLNYSSEQLEITQISSHVFQHTSYIDIPDYGKFPCNGVLYVHDGEVLVFDTPIDDSSSAELIYWLQDQNKLKIKALVVHHFHVDFLGGLNVFHESGIPSYGSEKTIALADSLHPVIPQNGFNDILKLSIGDQITETRFFWRQTHT